MAKLPNKKKKNTKDIKPFDEMDTKLAAGTLGTLHMADKIGNTPAWQNRMKKNKKGGSKYISIQELADENMPDGLKSIFKSTKGFEENNKDD